MKSLNRNLLVSAVQAGFAIVTVGVTSAAMADPATYIPAATDISVKFVNREVSFGAGDELFGILNITQINSADSSTTYWNGNGVTDGMQLVGYFENLTAGPDQTGGTGISFSGGNGALYLVANGTYSPGTNPNTKDYDNQLCGGSCAALTPWLTFDFVSGINDAINGDATIQAALATTNVQAGFGYLSVTGGTNMAMFDTDSFTFNNFGPADMSFRSNFVLANDSPGSSCTSATSNGWDICSDDPLAARTANVPEPGSLALLGIGIAALATGLTRRKRYYQSLA